MSAAKVDVLAVMEREARCLASFQPRDADELLRARDAVAALIVASKNALREAAEAMPADERARFIAGESGPVWMFSLRDALAKVQS